jgi:DNA-binding XRE family transcriptional regulator
MARDLTQTELAWRAGISRQALSAIESGAYHPGVAIAIRLGAGAFGLHFIPYRD